MLRSADDWSKGSCCDSGLSVRGLPGLDPAAELSVFCISWPAPPIRRDRIRKSCSKTLPFLDFAPCSSFKKYGCAGNIAKCTNYGLPDRDAKVAGDLDRSGAADSTPDGITSEVPPGATIGSVNSDSKLNHALLSRHQSLDL